MDVPIFLAQKNVTKHHGFYLYADTVPLRKPQLLVLQRLVKTLYLALIANYSQLHDRMINP